MLLVVFVVFVLHVFDHFRFGIWFELDAKNAALNHVMK